MPRKPRTYLPGVPSHVVQRGNNRDACYFAVWRKGVGVIFERTITKTHK